MTETDKDYKEKYGKSTLGELLEEARNGKDIGTVRGYADRVITLDKEFWNDKAAIIGGESNKDIVINKIWGFASRFEGHEEVVDNEEEETVYENPLNTPLEDFLDFFKAADMIIEKCDAELDNKTKSSRSKKKNIEEIRDSVGEDAERVAEALFHSIADRLAEKDPKLARLMGRFDESLETEGAAEQALEEGPDFKPVLTTSGFGFSLDSSNAEGVQVNAENRRVRLSREIVEELKPVLTKLHIFDAINDWYEFSNPQEEESSE